MCNVLLKTVIKFKLKFFGFLIEEEAFWCLFHLNIIFASLPGPNCLHLYILNIVVLMLALGLETLKKLCCFFFPTLHHGWFTLVCVKHMMKQIRHSLPFAIYPFIEIREVLLTLFLKTHF